MQQPSHDENSSLQWFAMRDLTRSNAKDPAYKFLAQLQFEVFTPMQRKLVVRNGKRISLEVPVMHDLLFVHASQSDLEPVVRRRPTLQFRYVRGGFCKPMTIPDEEMERFILAVRSSKTTRYFRPEELTAAMLGARVRLVGGHLDGREGYLLKVRGSKTRRLLVELPNFLTAAVEVQPDLIELIEEA